MTEQLIARLKAEQAQYAQDALRNPGDKTEFEFGRRVGHLEGIDRALSVLLGLLEEGRREDDPL